MIFFFNPAFFDAGFWKIVTFQYDTTRCIPNHKCHVQTLQKLCADCLHSRIELIIGTAARQRPGLIDQTVRINGYRACHQQMNQRHIACVDKFMRTAGGMWNLT